MTLPPSRGPSYDKTNWKWFRLRLVIESLLNKFPPLKRLVAYFWRRLFLLQHNWTRKKHLSNHDPTLDIGKSIWVDTSKIEFASLIEFNQWKYKGASIEGDWDLLEKRFDDMDVYLAFKERYRDGKSWEDTFFYRYT